MSSPRTRHDGAGQAINASVVHDGVQAAQSCWRIVAMADYEVPMDDSANVMKKRWKFLRRLLRGVDKEADVARAEAELRALPNVRLANLVPPIDWSVAGEVLGDVHGAVMDDHASSERVGQTPPVREDCPVRFLVCQPGCDHAAIIQHWARRRCARVLTLPEPAQIIAGDASWLEALPKLSNQTWVLPSLERCFLRHANGLDLVRRFLERALSGELGLGVIGCDSWAFAFIQRIWPISGASVLTLGAFDGAALADFFLRPTAGSDRRHRTRFVSARSGEPLLPVEAQTSSQEEQSGKQSEQSLAELRQLAAHCRGNPALAWHYWRKQLRSEPEHVQHDGGQQQVKAAPGDQRAEQLHVDIVWVAPEVAAPVLPLGADEEFALIFHALLLHRSLTTDVLALLLPVPRARITAQLLRMQALGLLLRDDPFWLVAPLAYPAVREFLHARGFLIDAF